MHEVSIVEALIEQVRHEVDQSGATGRIVRLDLCIGRLSGVCCDSIQFAMEWILPGTLLEGAEVHIDQPRAVCHCSNCHRQTEIDQFVAKCPACESLDIHIEGGQQLLLQSIEIEDSNIEDSEIEDTAIKDEA